MANRSKVGFGSSAVVQSVVDEGKLDAFDLLMLDGDTDVPKVGWVDANGNVVIVPTAEPTDLTEVKAEVKTKADAQEVEDSYEKVRYEISNKPVGTLVNYTDKEIRVMCPTGTEWALQNSGEGSDADKYYIGFKAYAPEGVVSFKEDVAETISDETMYYFEDNEFAGADEYGRKYSIVWLPVAIHADGAWTYYGANSSNEKYIGWYYSVEWYDANGIVVASDCIRINLSNEECHGNVNPFFVNDMISEMKAYCDEVVANATTIQVVEF